MSAKFIKIQESRIKITPIKGFRVHDSIGSEPYRVTIKYSLRNNLETECFAFNNPIDRDNLVAKLDELLNVM